MITFLSACAVLSSLIVTTQTTETKKVVCYYYYWSNYYQKDGQFRVENIDPYLCTHVVYGYISLNNCNSHRILDPDLQFKTRGKDDFGKFVGLRKQNKDLKILIAVREFQEGSPKFIKMLGTMENREDFVDDLRHFVNENDFDGVSIDWHFPILTTPSNGFLEFLTDLKKKVPEKIVAIAGSGYPSGIENSYNISEITSIVDFVSLLTIDYNGPFWSDNKTGMVAPLYGRKDKNGHVDPYNQDSSVKYWLNHGANRTKLLLGIPTYGRTFRLRHKGQTDVGAPTVDGVAFFSTNEKGIASYLEVLDSTSSEKGWITYSDEEQKVPYMVNDDIWISFENETSVDLKADYILENNLGGAAIHSLDLDDFRGKRYPLARTVRNKLFPDNSTSTSSPVFPSTITPTPTIPETTDLPEFNCYKNALYMDFANCRKYYECVHNENDNSYRLFHRNCPEEVELFFSETHCRCEWELNAQDCLKPADDSVQTEGCLPEETIC